MDALHKLMSFGAAPATVLPHLAAHAVFTLAAAWLLARRLSRRRKQRRQDCRRAG